MMSSMCYTQATEAEPAPKKKKATRRTPEYFIEPETGVPLASVSGCVLSSSRLLERACTGVCQQATTQPARSEKTKNKRTPDYKDADTDSKEVSHIAT